MLTLDFRLQFCVEVLELLMHSAFDFTSEVLAYQLDQQTEVGVLWIQRVSESPVELATNLPADCLAICFDCHYMSWIDNSKRHASLHLWLVTVLDHFLVESLPQMDFLQVLYAANDVEELNIVFFGGADHIHLDLLDFFDSVLVGLCKHRNHAAVFLQVLDGLVVEVFGPVVVEEIQDQVDAVVFDAPDLSRYKLILSAVQFLDLLAFTSVGKHFISKLLAHFRLPIGDAELVAVARGVDQAQHEVLAL